MIFKEKQMNWDDLRLFLEVARSTRLVEAARRLDIDHSTLSRRLRRFEATLGTQLLERNNQGCVLTPHGYHYVHMPIAGTVLDLRWISGRAFPQNQDALRHIPRIYERNERATLRCRSHDGHEFMLVLVGASLIGGIHLRDLRRRDWVRSRPFAWNRRFARGEELGHFSFGSTVVLLVPPALAGLPPPLGMALRMGQHLW